MSDKTSLTRTKHKGVEDQEQIHSILDASSVGYISWAEENQPYLIPLAYVRDGDRLLFHGSTGAGALRKLATGSPCCFSSFVLDGYVLARSAFESSMHYRSVVAFGVCRVLDGEEKVQAMNIVTEGLFPERTATLRPMLDKEIAATLILELPLDEVSAKVSADQPHDEGDDISWPVWAGVVPIHHVLGTPAPADNLMADFETVPEYIARWTK
jgi:nitroimidazol reductase NimA-like FMN-containing flavoprotein (pyridoxamine 5'-phosphate oxidase superfamily)